MTTKILCELCSYPISDDRCGIELKCSTIPAPNGIDGGMVEKIVHICYICSKGKSDIKKLIYPEKHTILFVPSSGDPSKIQQIDTH